MNFIVIRHGAGQEIDLLANPNCGATVLLEFIERKCELTEQKEGNGNLVLDLCNTDGGFLGLSKMGMTSCSEVLSKGKVYIPVYIHRDTDGTSRKEMIRGAQLMLDEDEPPANTIRDAWAKIGSAKRTSSGKSPDPTLERHQTRHQSPRSEKTSPKRRK